eukprot:356675-Chlamydomonas_euryale.AAC.4
MAEPHPHTSSHVCQFIHPFPRPTTTSAHMPGFVPSLLHWNLPRAGMLVKGVANAYARISAHAHALQHEWLLAQRAAARGSAAAARDAVSAASARHMAAAAAAARAAAAAVEPLPAGTFRPDGAVRHAAARENARTMAALLGDVLSRTGWEEDAVIARAQADPAAARALARHMARVVETL